MSLHLPFPISATSRRGAARFAVAGALATAALVAAMAAMPASAQNGPMTVPAAPAAVSGVASADPGMVPAQKAVNDKRYEDAIKQYDKVLASNPRNAQARFQRAWAMAQAGHDDDAIRAFSEMAQDFPELPEPHNNLGLLYAKRGDLKRAEAELLLAIDAKPDYAIAYSNLGDVYRRLAENAYGNALRRNPGDTRAAASLRQLGVAAPAPASAPAAAPAAPARRKAPASAPAAR